MKQVVTEIPTVDFILTSKISLSRFYGAEIPFFKGFIHRKDDSHFSNFKLYLVNNITTGNGIVSGEDPILSQCIKKVIDSGYKVFEFDTYQELFVWLAK